MKNPPHIIRKFNPVVLLIGFSILAFVLRQILFPEYTDAALVGHLESVLSFLGNLGVVYLLGIYVFCSFFFIPILIPLNIACGALYGPVLGSIIGLVGIVLSCISSTVSVRYVFKGMGQYAMSHREVKKFLNQISRHGIVVVIIVRLAFVVPYLMQNMVLALSNIRQDRLLTLTLVGALPGVVTYSFLGAGLVNLDNAGTYGAYLLVPLVLLFGVSLFIHFLRRQNGIGRSED